MKGIAHFATGVAMAACFPEAVAAAETGHSLYFILGGVFGLLPDTLDFKVYRFFYRHHVEVTPDPLAPDPAMIANALADAIARADAHGTPYRIKLNTIRLGADLWQRYTVTFNLNDRLIDVTFGPVVDTGGNPVTPAPPEARTATTPLPATIKLDYLAATDIDIFDGPLFEMTPDRTGAIIPRFIPWHRQWSHSLLVGLLLAAPAWLLWDVIAAGVVASAYAAHVVLDQLGYMGSSLFWPLTRRRTPGFKLQHSGAAFPNIATVWLSCLLIFWNLAHVTTRTLPTIPLMPLLLWGAVVPLATIRLLLHRGTAAER